ncbi:hypothetical protein CFI11_10590 [Thalassococcus sp. S3]|nr:hypothetical protein CFI11_10590 [Thalassococcus sp. S3]
MARRYILTLMLALAGALAAGHVQAACSKLPQLSDLLEASDLSLDGHRAPDQKTLIRLNNLTMSLSRARLQANLQSAGHKASYPHVSLFVTDVALFAATGLRDGPEAAQRYALKSAFQVRLDLVRTLLEEICGQDSFTKERAVTLARLGELSIATLRGIFLDASGVFRLGSVFAVLLMLVFTLSLGRLSINWLNSYMRFRHACQLPAQLICGPHVIDGNIIVVGRQGCNFRPVAPPGSSVTAAMKRGSTCRLTCGTWTVTAKTNRGLTSTVGLLFDDPQVPSVLRTLLRSSRVPVRRTTSRGEQSEGLLTQIFQH